jgi:hypothetical protein
MRRGLVESVLRLVLVYPYRCENCNSRFFRFRPVVTKAPKQ